MIDLREVLGSSSSAMQKPLGELAKARPARCPFCGGRAKVASIGVESNSLGRHLPRNETAIGVDIEFDCADGCGHVAISRKWQESHPWKG